MSKLDDILYPLHVANDVISTVNKEDIKTLFKELIDASWKEFTSESEPHELRETLTEKVDEL